MAYEKQNFVDGNTLYANQLNHIEDGIAAIGEVINDSTITSTNTWSSQKLNDKFTGASVLYTGTLPSTGWEGSEAPYTVSVSLSGILSTDYPIVDMTPTGTFETDSAMSEDWAKIYRIVTGDNSLMFYATDLLQAAVPFTVRCFR